VLRERLQHRYDVFRCHVPRPPAARLIKPRRLLGGSLLM
jgi:hypothetical protein